VSKQFESDFREIQEILSSFKQIDQTRLNPEEILTKVSSSLPNGVVLQSLSFKDGAVDIKGGSLNEEGLKGFIFNIGKAGFSDIELSSISYGPLFGKETTISFSIKAKFNK